jgi:DNA repair exonuclease SbcCD ATPase subunit
MITLKTLRWDNCFSYGTGNELNLSESVLTQVLGTNGVGKSSIPVILEEVLYNKNSRGIKKADIQNRNISKGYSIYLEFSKDEDTYEIFVERGSTIKVKLVKNGTDMSSHTATNTYKNIQDIIGIDFKTFSQVVYQNTNSSLQFLTATDTNRKKFLIDLLNLENYIEYFEIFKAAAKECSDNVTRLEGQLSTVEKWLESNKLDGTMVLPLLEIPNKLEEDEKELRSLLVEIKNISQKNRKIEENNQYKKLLGSINITEYQNSIYKEPLSYDSFQESLGSANSEIARINASLKKMTSLGDVCHTCEQAIPTEFKTSLIDQEREALKALLLEKEELEAKIALAQKHNREVTKTQKKIQEWEELFKLVDKTLPADYLSEEELKQQAADIESTISDRNKEIDSIVKENQKRTSSNTRLQVIREQTDKFKEQLETTKAALEVEIDKQSKLETLKKAFSTNGLVAYKIENLVKELEELTNTYLSELSDGRFTLAFVVTNDKLNVEITDNGQLVDILALSSGELARVNTSTLLAIRKLMSSISTSKINVLFLDEVINVLDDQGKEKLVEVLLQEEDLNTYLVSHGWTHPLLDKIEVIKSSNISRLEV